MDPVVKGLAAIEIWQLVAMIASNISLIRDLLNPHATCCHVFHESPNILGDSWGTVLSPSVAEEVKEKMNLNGLSCILWIHLVLAADTISVAFALQVFYVRLILFRDYP